MKALKGDQVEGTAAPTPCSRISADQLRSHDAEWDFCVQLLRDPERQPVEDASAEWQEEVSPFQRVGRLHVPAQDSWAPALVEKVNKTLRFSPWTGLAAHFPLGNVNRARRGAYRHSADFRAATNRCPIHEPG